MIKVKNLTKIYKIYRKSGRLIQDIFFRRFEELVALDNVSFEIGEDELVGFIGPNGAGKTTTLKILSGILYPSQGEINVLGYFPFDKKEKFLKQIAFIMGQRNQLIWDLPAIDTFFLNKEIYEIEDKIFKKNLDILTSLFNAQKLINQPVKMLSLGERMKMELIAGLLHSPKVIFLDEPTIGLDIFSQETIRQFIKSYQKEFRASIILTSHYLEDVKKLAKKLIIINQGKIVYNDNLKNIINQFSKEKYVSLILEKKIKPDLFKNIGQIVSYQFPKIVLKVKNKNLPTTISFINQKIAYDDLTIEEERIEEIIKKFLRKDHS